MTAHPHEYRIGAVAFDPLSRALRDATGEIAQLRPQTAEVLSYLLEHGGTTVSKGALMQAVWPDTAVTDDSLVQCISEIRKALGPSGSHLLQTIPRKGYRLDGSTAQAIGSAPVRGRARIAILAGVVLAIGLAGAAWVWTWSEPLAPQPDLRAAQRSLDGLPALAVLPFDNLSDDPEQSYFSDGVTDDLITELSKLSGLVVIARATSFAYRDAGQGAEEISARLGVRYILQGSVRRAGDRVRINTQLIDGQSGANVWAERYEGDGADVFALQDTVTSAVADALKVKLTSDEARRIARPATDSATAYDLYLQGVRVLSFFNPEANADAENLFRQAIALDPAFAGAHANLAQALSLAAENGWTDDPAGAIEAAFAAARKGIELDPELPYAHWSLGRLYTRPHSGDYEAARTAFETAVSLNPNYADGYMFLALTSIFTGRIVDAPPLIEKAMRLNPDYPFWYLQTRGMVQYFSQDYEAAARSFEAAVERNPTVPWLYHLLIATYGRLGQFDDADWMVAELSSLGQPTTIRGIMKASLVGDPALQSDFEEGLRMAGLPEE